MKGVHRIWRAGGCVIGLLAVLAMLTAPVPGLVRADDWPQWRGRLRDGVWKETLDESHRDWRVLWRTAAGAGWASPVVAGGRVYLFDAVLEAPVAHERLSCHVVATGKVVWTQRYPAAYPAACFQPGTENGPTSTPIVDAGKIFAFGQMGDVRCWDAATGAVVWKRQLKAPYQMKDFGINGSPLIEGGLLIMAIGGKPQACVVALDKSTGREVWRALDDDASNSSPIVVTAAGRRQLILWTQQSVAALDPQNGKTLWTERLLTSSDNAVSTPVSDGSLLLVGGLMFKLDEVKPGAAVLWPETRSVSHRVLSHTSTAMLHDGCVYSARSKGGFVCLDAATGQELWQTDQVTRPKSGAAVHITRCGDCFLLYNDQGELIGANLTREGYREKHRAFLLEPDQPFGGNNVNWSAPAFANGRVFVRNQKEFVCGLLGQPRRDP